MPDKKTTLYLPESLHTAAKVMAARRRITLTLLLREALVEKLAKLATEPATTTVGETDEYAR